MSTTLSAIDTMLNSSLFREIRRMEEAQRIWNKCLEPANAMAVQMESIRTMLGPLAEIRKSLVADSHLQQTLGAIERPSSVVAEMAKAARMADEFGNATRAMNDSMQSSLVHAQQVFSASSVTNSFSQAMKAFEEVEKRWSVPAELVSSIGALRAMQEQVGRLTLPVFDFASASTLAKILGPAGLEAQLTALGIGPDGLLFEEASAPVEEGIGLSRASLELLTLLSFIFSILAFIHQELSSSEWQQKTDDKLDAQSQLLITQAKQLESLSHLVEKALVQEAKRTEQRFVVRERVAVVRRKPEHGATVEGKLLPREVVKPISEQGKWVQFEYYHWLLQSYQTGWALKKYFKRVPASYNDTLSRGPQ